MLDIFIPSLSQKVDYIKIKNTKVIFSAFNSVVTSDDAETLFTVSDSLRSQSRSLGLFDQSWDSIWGVCSSINMSGSVVSAR